MYIWSWKIFLSAFIPRLSPTPVSVWTLLFLHFIVNKKSVKMCRLHKRIVMTWQTAIIIGSGVVAVRCSVAHTSCGGDTPPYHCVCVHLLSNSSWWSPWLLHLFSCHQLDTLFYVSSHNVPYVCCAPGSGPGVDFHVQLMEWRGFR